MQPKRLSSDRWSMRNASLGKAAVLLLFVLIFIELERLSCKPPRSLLLSASVSEVPTTTFYEVVPSYPVTCTRMLWLSGLQVVTASGSESHYLESAAKYMRYYAAALKSAKANAPSLVPVLVFLNNPPKKYLEWVEVQGAIVIRHHVSFQQRIKDVLAADPNNPKLAKIDHLTASYARLDVPAVMDQAIVQLLKRGISDVDTEYVLWTDPDVLFETDVTSCSLPKPHIVSIGAETIPGTIANCGVMYYNVRAFELTQAALLEYADSKHWEFDDDQDLFRHFFQPWMVTALPDAYNYKPYWGEPKFLKPEPLFKEQALAEVVIVHTHGPKPSTSLCVIDYIAKHRIPVRQNRDLVVEHLQQITQQCQLGDIPWLDVVVRLMASAAAADGGQMFRRVQRLHDMLCPGQCWE